MNWHNQSLLAAAICITLITGNFMRTYGEAPLNSDQALAVLTEGNKRFVEGHCEHPHLTKELRHKLASGQHPFVTIMTCADSRVPVELLFDQGIGDTFVIRVAGNVSDIDEIGSIEYGVCHLHTPLLVIMGHTRCGAVTAVFNQEELHGCIPSLVDNITPAVVSAKENEHGESQDQLIMEAIKSNVWNSIKDLLKGSPEVLQLAKEGAVKIVGAIYDIDSGVVSWLGEHPQKATLLHNLEQTFIEAVPSSNETLIADVH
jgi:carbonic anhydrase